MVHGRREGKTCLRKMTKEFEHGVLFYGSKPSKLIKTYLLTLVRAATLSEISAKYTVFHVVYIYNFIGDLVIFLAFFIDNLYNSCKGSFVM